MAVLGVGGEWCLEAAVPVNAYLELRVLGRERPCAF